MPKGAGAGVRVEVVNERAATSTVPSAGESAQAPGERGRTDMAGDNVTTAFMRALGREDGAHLAHATLMAMDATGTQAQDDAIATAGIEELNAGNASISCGRRVREDDHGLSPSRAEGDSPDLPQSACFRITVACGVELKNPFGRGRGFANWRMLVVADRNDSGFRYPQAAGRGIAEKAAKRLASRVDIVATLIAAIGGI